MVIFLSAIAGALLLGAVLISALSWDEVSGKGLILEGGSIFCAVVLLSIARDIGG